MAKLNDDHKRIVVQRLATFVSYTEIVAELKALGVEVSMPQIAHYDPKTKNAELAPKWRELYNATREKFIADTSDIAIAHRSYRLRELDRMYANNKRAARENVVLGRDLLVEAEKFVGEAYSNKRVIESADPAAALANLLGVTADDLLAAVAGVGDNAGAGAE